MKDEARASERGLTKSDGVYEHADFKVAMENYQNVRHAVWCVIIHVCCQVFLENFCCD